MIDAVRFIGKGIDKYLADSSSYSFKGATCNKDYKKDLKDTPSRGSLIAKSMKQVCTTFVSTRPIPYPHLTRVADSTEDCRMVCTSNNRLFYSAYTFELMQYN